jgi:hypothetical protein
MAGRQNPPHDRVTLSYEERRTLARLEGAFAGRSYSRRRRFRAGARSRDLRVRTHRLWRTLCLAAPCVVLTGLAFVIASFLPVASLFGVGVVLVGAGAVPAAKSPWLRSRVACVRARLR